MSTSIHIDTTIDGGAKSQKPKSWFKTSARWYQNETDQRRDITDHQAWFWALADTQEEALTAIKASNAFQDNLLGTLSDPVPTLSRQLQGAKPILISEPLFDELQGSVYEGSAVVFFIEPL